MSLPSQSIKLTASCSESCIYFKVTALAVSAPFPPIFFFFPLTSKLLRGRQVQECGETEGRKEGGLLQALLPEVFPKSEPQDRPSCCEIMDQLLRSEDKQHSSSSPGGYPRSGAFQLFPAVGWSRSWGLPHRPLRRTQQFRGLCVCAGMGIAG